MQAQQVQQADITFTGIVQNTVGLGDVLKAELPEIAQFEKVSIHENSENNYSLHYHQLHYNDQNVPKYIEMNI